MTSLLLLAWLAISHGCTDLATCIDTMELRIRLGSADLGGNITL
jgi:hypothetical protein